MNYKGIEYSIAVTPTPGIWKWQFRIGDEGQDRQDRNADRPPGRPPGPDADRPRPQAGRERANFLSSVIPEFRGEPASGQRSRTNKSPVVRRQQS
jgi:hypothetical protein